MPSMIRLGVSCALVLATTACAGHAPSPSATDEHPSRPAPRRQRDVISKEELEEPAIRSQSVLEVVKVLRPQFLNDRGSHGMPYSGQGGTDADKARLVVDAGTGRVHASIDNGKIVSLDELRGLPANGVLEIRFLSPAAAMQKFGGAALEGPVILVKTTP